MNSSSIVCFRDRYTRWRLAHAPNSATDLAIRAERWYASLAFGLGNQTDNLALLVNNDHVAILQHRKAGTRELLKFGGGALRFNYLTVHLAARPMREVG